MPNLPSDIKQEYLDYLDKLQAEGVRSAYELGEFLLAMYFDDLKTTQKAQRVVRFWINEYGGQNPQ